MSTNNLMNDSKLLTEIITNEKITRAYLSSVLGFSKQYLGKIINGQKPLSRDKKLILSKLYPNYFSSEPIIISNEFTKDTLADVRRTLGYSQSELARALGVSLSLVNKYEKGERNISSRTLDKIHMLLEEEIPNHSSYNVAYAPNITLDTYKPNMDYRDYVKVDRLLLDNRLDLQNHKLTMLTVGNNDLYPSYEPYDRVIICTSIDKFINGYIYLFEHNGVRYIRQVSILPDKIKCAPLNEKLDTFYLSLGGDRYEILGLIIPRFRA